MKIYRILSLGAGVQSTVVYIKAMKGEIEGIDAAIFADTQEEPAEVYRHLEWMKSLGGPKIYVGTAGKLGDDLVKGKNQRRDGKGGRCATIPAFTAQTEGVKEGLTRRQCTYEYKLAVIDQVFRREIVGLAPRQRMPKDIQRQSLIGISIDESKRMLRIRDSHREKAPKWDLMPEFPLITQAKTRADCLEYLDANCPHEVPRSACVFCPYHDNKEWRRLKADPAIWKRIVEVDASLRVEGNAVNRGLRSKLYLHRSCLPITQVDFGTAAEDKAEAQLNLGFWKECLGMCGN